MVVDRVYSKKYPNSIVWRDVSWNFYLAMLREFDERPSRINYDRGTLEVMSHPRARALQSRRGLDVQLSRAGLPRPG